MKSKLISFLLALLLFSGCTTIEVPSATPTPAPEATPTQEIRGFTDCFGAYQSGFTLINTNVNPCLGGEAFTTDLGTEDGRYASYYEGYYYWQVAGEKNTLAYMNTGLYSFRGNEYPAMEITVTQIDGDFGVSFDQVFDNSTCHIVKQTGWIGVIPGNTSGTSIWLEGAISVSDFTTEGEFVFPPQSFPSVRGTYEINWRVLNRAGFQVDTAIRLWTRVNEAGFLSGSVVRIHAIEVMIAPSGFCEDETDPNLIILQ